MPHLHCLVSITKNAVGFLLPVFQLQERSNYQYVQKIDEHDNVVSFDPVLLNSEDTEKIAADIYLEIGQQAIWAFKDHNNALHVGTASQIQSIGIHLLNSGALNSHPMAAADMAHFCQAEEQYPHVLNAAYRALKEISAASANTWRDAVVLLPAIKSDIARELNRSSSRMKIDDVMAISRDGTTHIYSPPAISLRGSQLKNWRKLAKIFHIDAAEFHSHTLKSEKVDQPPPWSIVGIGGTARYVITKSPFFGASPHSTAPDDGAVAHGIQPPSSIFERGESSEQLLIGIVGSEISRAHSLAAKTQTIFQKYRLRHAINIRPIGTGTPNPRKANPKEISDILRDFNRVWIIANHRQRLIGNYFMSLSAASTASRATQMCATGLIACLRSPEGTHFLKEASFDRGFGLFGSTRYLGATDATKLIRQVLHNMLCEDALLHTASRIVILWPYRVAENEKFKLIKFGRHEYEVELLEISAYKPPQVAGYALNVQLALHTSEEYRDFCLSLASGYDWELRHDDGRSFTLEYEGEIIRIWPTPYTAAIETLLKHRSEYGPERDIIITNKTISEKMNAIAYDQKWGIAHHTELTRWMHLEL